MYSHIYSSNAVWQQALGSKVEGTLLWALKEETSDSLFARLFNDITGGFRDPSDLLDSIIDGDSNLKSALPQQPLGIPGNSPHDPNYPPRNDFFPSAEEVAIYKDHWSPEWRLVWVALGDAQIRGVFQFITYVNAIGTTFEQALQNDIHRISNSQQPIKSLWGIVPLVYFLLYFVP